MADTRRELAALQTLFADNTSGDISAQDGRDELISSHPSQVVQSGTYASIPSTGRVTGDLYFCTDTSQVFRWSGSVWVPFGPIWKLGDCTLQTWSWVNQGSASVASNGSSLYLTAPSNGGSNSARMRVHTAPSAPYSFTAKLNLQCDWSESGYGSGGVGFRESSSGKMVTCEVWTQTGGGGSFIFRVVKWTDSTNISSTPVNANYYGYGDLFIRLADNGTNRIISVSPDGINFIAINTEARTTFLTADQVGFGCNPYSQESGVGLLSWLQG